MNEVRRFVHCTFVLQGMSLFFAGLSTWWLSEAIASGDTISLIAHPIFIAVQALLFHRQAKARADWIALGHEIERIRRLRELDC